jgi:hypothetical protein
MSSESEFTDVPFVEAPSSDVFDMDNGAPSDTASYQEERPMTSDPAPFNGRVFVAGASGFVGSKVCQLLMDQGAKVVGLSRGGKPDVPDEWADNVEWISGSALDPEVYRSALSECDSVVSCIGGFGATDSYLNLVNGDCTIKLCEIAKDTGASKFVFISVHDYKLPDLISKVGYFAGKRNAESRIGELFGSDGYILKPGFIYGPRKVMLKNPVSGEKKTVTLPLNKIGEPASELLSMAPFQRLAKSGLPFADAVYTQPLSVIEVAYAAAKCAVGTVTAGVRAKSTSDMGARVLDVDDIKRMK